MSFGEHCRSGLARAPGDKDVPPKPPPPTSRAARLVKTDYITIVIPLGAGGIVSQKLRNEAHRILSENHRARANTSRAKTPALLKGLIRCGHCDCSMGPTFTRKKGKTYTYYLCVGASRSGYASCPVKSVPAGDVETAVVDQLRAVFKTPEIVARTYREAKARESEELERVL